MLDKACISGHAVLKGECVVSGKANILGDAVIKDSAVIRGVSIVLENAVISHNAVVEAYSIIGGHTSIAINAHIKGDNDFIVVGPFGSTSEYITAYKDNNNNIYLSTNYFSGSMEGDFYKYALDSHLLSENEFKILKQLYHYVLLQNEKKE